jgi:hypothetical protein
LTAAARGAVAHSGRAQRNRDWSLFSWSPAEDRIIRFGGKAEAGAELVRVQSYAANARLYEIG